jgi:hypothetical protein
MSGEAFQRNTFMFWRSISLLDEIARRLLKEEGLSAGDAELVRQKHKEPRPLGHDIEASRER